MRGLKRDHETVSDLNLSNNGNGEVGNSGDGFIVGYPVMVQALLFPVARRHAP
ncbi:hypothetical protein [Methanocella conradii]|uniref:hypothetical protein n=1 Tax=Methanocella conradii TaxID=1175444 RepID=UPI0013052415|nr:hypothetical protein [Methanocella conradii]